MGIAKIVLNDVTQIDLTADTVAQNNLLSGYTAHDKTGTAISGSVSQVEQATPSININGLGLITASATQQAGIVAQGTKSATHQLTTHSGGYITPGASQITAVAQGRYTTGVTYVRGDANLRPENIKDGVTIFNVTGTYSGSAGGGNLLYATTQPYYEEFTGLYEGNLPQDFSFYYLQTGTLPQSIPIITVIFDDGFSQTEFPVYITSISEYTLMGFYYDQWSGGYAGEVTITSSGGITVNEQSNPGPDLTVCLIGIVGIIDNGGGGEVEGGFD